MEIVIEVCIPLFTENFNQNTTTKNLGFLENK
jgi:hypothetical protein